MTLTTAESHLEIIRRHYPTAISTIEGVNRFFDVMQRCFNVQPGEILSADSLCSDEINSIEYPRRAYEMLGPFKLGGLDGFPFVGLTGMGAFAAHVPECGAVFIYHAPHIGVTEDGALGFVRRAGQDKPSGCCGACRAALAKLQSGEIADGERSDLDYQQQTIEQILFRQRDRILGAQEPLKEATDVMYEAICERINVLTERTTFNARYLVLMGAVLINGDHSMGSFNAVRRFDVVDLKANERHDLLEEFYR